MNLHTNEYRGGENFDLRQVLLRGRTLKLKERVAMMGDFLNSLMERQELLCQRCVTSAADREVSVVDSHTGEEKRMQMFGSNNYLGLANHPYVRARAEAALREYGIGVGGPPLLNGYTRLHRELEERLADLKCAEDALIFSSGYGANVGLVTGLMNGNDSVYYDAYSHASFTDGIRMAGVQSFRFPHNDMERLREMLDLGPTPATGDIFVGVEGVYSMDGDLAPLDELLELCRARSAYLVLDDAHGTGVMGGAGRGTAEHFGLEGQIDVTMGTFSKVFAATGGFVAASKPIVDYLRYFARSYMFSASLPPVTAATVLAGLDVIAREPELRTQLHENVHRVVAGLRSLGIDAPSESGIVPLLVPVGMNIRAAARKFHELGIFVNSIEYPAVPIAQQRFRISVMATHTPADIERLLEAVDHIWMAWRRGAYQDRLIRESAA